MKKVKVGVIGAGFISQVAHLRNLVECPGAEIVGLAELRPKLGAEVCQRYAIPELYKDHTELLEKSDAELVFIIVRRHHTGPIAEQVISNGRHLFTEKPMAQTYEKALYLAELSKRKNVKYGIGFMRRYDQGVIKAKKLLNQYLETKELGEIISVRVYLSAGGDYCNISGDIKSDEPKPMHVDWPIAPGWLPENLHKDYEHFVNVNGHDINLMRYLFGDPVEVNSVAYKPGKGSIVVFNYDNFHSIFQWADTFQLTRWEEGVEVLFEKGSIQLKLPPAFLINVPASVRVFKVNNRNESSVYKPMSDWSWSFRNEDYAMVESIKSDCECLSSAADSVKDMMLIEKIWKNIVENQC